MRSLIFTILILFLIIPTFLPIAPHGAIHALYDAHKLNHSESSHHDYIESDIFHDYESGKYIEHENTDHELPIDLASFYNNFLHIDLKNSDKEDFFSSILDNGQDIDYDILLQITNNRLYVLTPVQKRGPPVDQVFETNLSPLFLTSRIRI